MALGNKGKSAIQTGVDTLKPFRVGNVSGTANDLFDAGRMPEPFRTEYLNAMRDNRVRYVIRSYHTPIAWLTDEGWTIPPVPYSRTTSNHQSVTAVAVGNRGFYADVYRPNRRTEATASAPVPTRITEPSDVVSDIDSVLASVAADGWTNPYTDPTSPALALSDER